MDSEELKFQCLSLASELYKNNKEGNTVCLSAEEIIEHATKFCDFVVGAKPATNLKLVKE
jgi:hypothetical protein